jgi:hypothetical protein
VQEYKLVRKLVKGISYNCIQLVRTHVRSAKGARKPSPR